jgi:predicted nucleic acid-binding protein
MPGKYYLDTSIWMDLYEDRKGYNQEPLGDFAWKLLGLIKAKKEKLVISDLLIIELGMNYSMEKISGMVKLFEDMIEKIITTAKQRDEAKIIAKERNIPAGDVLHAILARDNKLILVTRDNHFRKLDNISKFYKPENLI